MSQKDFAPVRKGGIGERTGQNVLVIKAFGPDKIPKMKYYYAPNQFVKRRSR